MIGDLILIFIFVVIWRRILKLKKNNFREFVFEITIYLAAFLLTLIFYKFSFLLLSFVFDFGLFPSIIGIFSLSFIMLYISIRFIIYLKKIAYLLKLRKRRLTNSRNFTNLLFHIMMILKKRL
jgi:amino acid transporter